MMHECPIHHCGMVTVELSGGYRAAHCPQCYAEDERAEKITALDAEVERLRAELSEATDILNKLYEAPDMGECEDAMAKRERRKARDAAYAFLTKPREPSNG